MLASLLFICLAAWLGLAALLYFLQPSFVYFPARELAFTPAVLGLPHEDVTINSGTERLHGWFVPRPGSRRVLLFLHGNGGNISHRLDHLRLFHDLGLAVLIIDYQGYGQSSGRPSEEGTYRDALAAWNWLVNSRGHAPEDVVVYGESLGGAVAVWLAARTRPGALILQSTFTSIIDMGRKHYPWLPVRWLARIRYPSLERIGRVQAPLLIVHSRDDEIVPYQMGRRLFDAAGSTPRSFVDIRGGHNDGLFLDDEEFAAALRRFLEATRPAATAP